MPFFENERDDGGRDRGEPHEQAPAAYAAGSSFDLLLGSIDEVIREWRTLVTREPWAKLPLSRLVDSFPDILPKLLRLARSGVTHIDDGLRELIADAHGHFRRVDGMPLMSVTEEWAYLKQACRAVLDAHAVSHGDADRAMERLDILVDDAVGYTLRGYYRPELDSLRGRGLERREASDRRETLDRRSGATDRRDRGEG